MESGCLHSDLLKWVNTKGLLFCIGFYSVKIILNFINWIFFGSRSVSVLFLGSFIFNLNFYLLDDWIKCTSCY